MKLIILVLLFVSLAGALPESVIYHNSTVVFTINFHFNHNALYRLAANIAEYSTWDLVESSQFVLVRDVESQKVAFYPVFDWACAIRQVREIIPHEVDYLRLIPHLGSINRVCRMKLLEPKISMLEAHARSIQGIIDILALHLEALATFSACIFTNHDFPYDCEIIDSFQKAFDNRWNIIGGFLSVTFVILLFALCISHLKGEDKQRPEED